MDLPLDRKIPRLDISGSQGRVQRPGLRPISVYLTIALAVRTSVCCWHMRQPAASVEELDDWEVLCSFLPKGWEQAARECGDLTRARGIAGADALLRVLLIHIAI